MRTTRFTSALALAALLILPTLASAADAPSTSTPWRISGQLGEAVYVQRPV